MNEFAYLDIILTVIALVLVFRGITQGFVREFFSLGAIIIGGLGALLFHGHVSTFLRDNYLVNVWGVPELLGFVSVFLVFFIVCKILQKILNDIINGLRLTGLNKLLGGILGFVEGIVLIFLVLFIMSVQPIFDVSGILGSSLFANMVLPLIPLIQDRGTDFINELQTALAAFSGYFG
jgi:membrane protein required for colicin V production